MAENQNIEWKENWRDEYLKWICGFANAQGGKIYLGVNDKGKVIGLKDANRLMKDIPNKVQDRLGISVDVNLLNNNGFDYIEIVINPCAFPINYKGEYHYRSGSTKQLLRGSALTNFLIAKTGIRWESAIVDNISIDSLDKESFKIFRRNAIKSGRMLKEELNIPDQELLEKLNLLYGGKLTRAGILCFYGNPERIISGCYVKIGKFEGSEILYQDEIHGSLIVIADRVIDIIYLKYLKATISYQKETRIETYPYAREAIREAVYNALIHCNWSDNIPVQIRIDENYMYINNSALLPFDWTSETLMQTHISRPFNPNIANVFYRAGYIENWGRGIQKMVDECTQLGSDKPEFIVHSSDIMVQFPAFLNEISESQYVSKNGDEDEDQCTPQDTPQNGLVSDQDSDQDSDQVDKYILKAIIDFCKIERSLKEIMDNFGYKNRVYFKKNFINKLLLYGDLKMTIPHKPNSKYQRYIANIKK